MIIGVAITAIVTTNHAPALAQETSNPAAGLDWPVRLLVYQDDKGDVLVLYTDFAWIAHRHGITDRDEAFKKAADVIASITSTVK
jgi:uncharacterized protein (DUF302 family)